VAVEVGISMVGGRVGGGKGLKKMSGFKKTVAKQAHMLQVRSKTSTVNTSHNALFFIGCLPIKNRAATFPVVQYREKPQPVKHRLPDYHSLQDSPNHLYNSGRVARKKGNHYGYSTD